MPDDISKRPYDSAFPHTPEADHGPEHEEAEAWRSKRPRYAENAEVSSGDGGVSDVTLAPMVSYVYDTPPGTTIEYTQGANAYPAHPLDPLDNNDPNNPQSPSHYHPFGPVDETWVWTSSHDANMAELCEKFAGVAVSRLTRVPRVLQARSLRTMNMILLRRSIIILTQTSILPTVRKSNHMCLLMQT
ncbi:hypothetical protein BDQ17DRAFT_489430 [Cyathus striatus]|nr:hypothetical protein BDQ17DRAFT_489430 [Cyathus striatus]